MVKVPTHESPLLIVKRGNTTLTRVFPCALPETQHSIASISERPFVRTLHLGDIDFSPRIAITQQNSGNVEAKKLAEPQRRQ